jgi:cytochrome c oxidase accessory protein FixG
VDYKAQGLGACVDCDLCVHVCPTGIDIRKGLQYECIGCAGCIDVCDGVMDRMGYDRGLIRFTTQNALTHGRGARDILRHVLRARVLVYATILGSLSFALALSLALRTPLKVDVVRDRAALSRIVPGGKLENVYRLQVMNATEQSQKYRITATGLAGLTVASDGEVVVGPAESRWVAVRLQVPYGSAAPGSHPVQFQVDAAGDAAHVSEKAAFLVPR